MADLLKTMLFTAVVLVLIPGAAAAQEQPDVSLSLHGNTGSTPMLGISYHLAERTMVRLALGYYQFEKVHYEVDCSRAYPCAPPNRPLRRERQETVRQYSGSFSAFYQLFAWKLSATSVGLEGQYLRARAPTAVGISRRETNDRFSVSGLTRLSIRPVQWLAMSGEIGAGYLQGMPTNSSASFDLRTTRWGYTHVGLGLQVFW